MWTVWPIQWGVGAPHCPARVGSQAGVSQRLCPPHAVSVGGMCRRVCTCWSSNKGPLAGRACDGVLTSPRHTYVFSFPVPQLQGALPVCPSPVASASYSGKWVLSFQQWLLPPRLTPAASVARALGSAASTLCRSECWHMPCVWISEGYTVLPTLFL